jgi:general secretion pathway protein I
VPTETSPRNQGFTLLEVLVALGILAISVLVLVDSQTASVRLRQQGEEMVIGTLLARDIMTLVELRLEKEGFGELTITEHGDFHEEEYMDMYPEYEWEYEVSRVELDIGKILSMVSSLMGMAEDEGAVDDASMLTGGLSLESLGIDMSMFTDQLSRYVREVRVRVYWCGEEGARDEGECGPDELTLVTHAVNPTGRVANAEDQEIGGLGGIAGVGGGLPEGDTGGTAGSVSGAGGSSGGRTSSGGSGGVSTGGRGGSSGGRK